MSYTGNDNEYLAFLWTEDDGMRPLGVLPGETRSAATDINDNGVAIGPGSRTFIWDEFNGMRPLMDLLPGGLGWDQFVAYDINNAGQIVGYRTIIEPAEPGGTPTHHIRTYLLTPVPEPASLLLLALAGTWRIATKRM